METHPHHHHSLKCQAMRKSDVNVTGVESTEGETELPTPNDALSDELVQKLQELFSDISSISADETENITKNVDGKQVER